MIEVPTLGGMGAYSPAPIINKIIENKIINKIVKPTLFALKKEIILTQDFYMWVL